MIISGSTYRSIASQNILSYSLDLNINNTTGTAFFGFSGDSGNLNLFKFETGKIYDINNRHVWSYNPSETISISGNINTGDLNYYINNNIICLSSPKSNNYYKYFYTNVNNCIADVDLYIYGNSIPNYSISFPFENLIGNNITGYIYNNNIDNNLSFQIFTGDLFVQPYYSINNTPSGFLSGSRSGALIFKYTSTINPDSFSSGVVNFDTLEGYMLLQTNFGDINYNLNNIFVKPRPYYFIDFVELFTGILEDVYYRYNYIYELNTKSPTDQNVIFTLRNQAGHTGNLYYTGFLITGFISGTGSGFIHGTDYITGISRGTGISTELNYYNNYVSGVMTSFKQFSQNATGFIDYYYNFPIGGGSGLASGYAGLVISATGFINQNNAITGLEFIYGSRQITGRRTGILTGYWGPLIQTGTGFVNITDLSASTINFTGQNFINNLNLSWNGIPYLGYEIENFDNKYRIYGITGSGSIIFRTPDSGINTEKNRIFTQQNTGILTERLFKLSAYDIGVISGAVFGSETTNLEFVFGNESDGQWATSLSTGYLGFQFLNFSPSNSGIISHYEVDLNKNFSNISEYKFFPKNFKLQGSNNFSEWIDMDSRSNANFYEPYSNVYQVTGTGNYNFVRLLITSGQEWQHINKNILDTYSFGLSINKINFYKTLRNITGLYNDFIDINNQSNSFVSSFNTGESIYFSDRTGIGSASYLFSGLNIFDDWSSINTSLDGRVQIATAKNSYIYVSRNSGITWSTGLNLKKDWRDSSISFDGRVMTAVAFDDKIYISYDSGINWQNNYNLTKEWTTIDISYDGRNQIAFESFSPTPVHVSYNSGVTWSGLTVSNVPLTMDNTVFNSVAISKTGNIALAAGRFDLFYSTNTGLNWSHYQNIDSVINEQNWASVALSSDGRIWGGVGYYFDYYTNEYLDKIWINTNSGNINNWTGIPFYTGIDDFFQGPRLSHISFSFDGSKQAVSLIRKCTTRPCTGNIFTTDGGIYTSQNTGRSWSRGRSLSSGLLLENFKSVAVSSGGNSFFAVPAKQEDYLFSDDSANTDLWKAVNIDKNLYPYVEINGYNIGYQTSKAYSNNSLTGFYINFESGYSPESSLSIDISSSGDSYFRVFNKTGSISLTESGFLTGAIISTSSGYKYFRFQFDTGRGFQGSSPTLCYTGWKLNIVTTPINSWTSLATTKNAQIQFAVGKNYSGTAAPTSQPFTGIVYISRDFGQTWTGSRFAPSTSSLIASGPGNASALAVQLNSVAIDKNTGRYALISRDGRTYKPENFGIYFNNPDSYALYLSTNSGASFSKVQNAGSQDFRGGWTKVAMSHDGRVMMGVGIYDTTSVIEQTAIISRSFGAATTWVQATGLNDYIGITLDNTRSYNSLAMSSGGRIIYVGEYPGGIWKSVDSGVNWAVDSQFLYEYWNNLSTSYDGKYVSATTDAGGVYVSQDSGNSWSQWSIGNTNTYSVSLSSGGEYQIVVGSGMSAYRSNDFGNSWIQITGLDSNPYTASEMSDDGRYQYAAKYTGLIYNNCTFGNDLPTKSTRVKYLNLYTRNEKDYFNYNLNNITGYGIMQASSFGSGTGFLTPTGQILQPAITYQTGRITGILEDVGYLNIPQLDIGGTGTPNQVFQDIVTGSRQATGIINFNTGLLSEFDYIIIDNNNFTYRTGIPSNNYQFNTLSGLTNVLTSGALGLLGDPTLQDLGVTGFTNTANSRITLFSYSRIGESGNNLQLIRDANNLQAISIPNRYFRGGQTFRPPVTIWTGIFTGTFFNLFIENSGFYTNIYDAEYTENTVSGVIFENNFDKNWSINVTPISEGNPLDTGSQITLSYYSTIGFSGFSGNFNIKSGLGYLGYSGLNFNINKRSFNNVNNTGNRATYRISGDRFLFTGILEG